MVERAVVWSDEAHLFVEFRWIAMMEAVEQWRLDLEIQDIVLYDAWKGNRADKFIKTLNEEVKPSLERLDRALYKGKSALDYVFDALDEADKKAQARAGKK